MLAFRGAALAGAGLWLGTLASAWTTGTLRALPAFSPAQEIGDAEAVGSVESARSWARHAFAVGLRDCPDITEAYRSVCEAQMAEEARLAAEAAKWQVPQMADAAPVYVPDPEPEMDHYGVDEAPARMVPAVWRPDENSPSPEDMDGVVDQPPVVIAAAAPPVEVATVDPPPVPGISSPPAD